MQPITPLLSSAPAEHKSSSGIMALWSLRLLLQGELWRSLLSQRRFRCEETIALI